MRVDRKDLTMDKTFTPLSKTVKIFFLAVSGLTLFGLGFVSGWFSGKMRDSESASIRELRLSGYQFVSPLLECDGSEESVGTTGMQPFRRKIEGYIAEKKRSNWVSHISVYFRNLHSGLAFSIDGREKFTPASLLKVPLMIAYLKWAESNSGLLSTKVVFRGKQDQNAPQHVRPVSSIVANRSYTIDELLFSMIAYSDNNAYFLLYANIQPAILHHVYTDLGIEVPKVRQRTDYMTVAEYASFFRILFNASYLNKEMSEKALYYLAQADFKEGIVAGLPPGITAAQKFGEMTMGAQEEIKQMHDCGIVYYPGHPYLLCVMSRGSSFEYLDDAIRDISQLVFTEMDQQYREK
jgi:beta-lactamase class A